MDAEGISRRYAQIGGLADGCRWRFSKIGVERFLADMRGWVLADEYRWDFSQIIQIGVLADGFVLLQNVSDLASPERTLVIQRWVSTHRQGLNKRSEPWRGDGSVLKPLSIFDFG